MLSHYLGGFSAKLGEPMHECFTLDLGPEFIGYATRVGEKTVCAVTPAVQTDPAARQEMRDLAQRQGIDCQACCGCPAGTAE